MEKNKKEKKRYIRELIIMAILLAIVALTISYTVVNITMDAVGTSRYGVANWHIQFDSAEVVSKTGKAVVVYKPRIKGLSVHYEVKLKEVGDSVTIKAVVKNSGNMDAMLESYDVFGIPTEYEKNIGYKVTDEQGDYLAKNTFLPSSASDAKNRYMTVYLTISYNKLISESYDESSKVFNLGLNLNFVQKCSKCQIK